MNTLRIRKLIGGLSFASVLFVFQACYGTSQDFGLDVMIEGQVVAKSTGNPVTGIKVSVGNNMQYEYTDNDGRFSFYTEHADSYHLTLEDLDPNEGGTFATKDTVITTANDRILLNITLEEQ